MIVNGWYSGAERDPGPVNKVYPGVNPGDWYVCHSFEGNPATYPVLYDPDAPKSWHFTQWPDGRLQQHYPITARCFASGNQWINERAIATELVGVAGDPITAAAINAQMGLFRAIQDYSGRTIVRRSPPFTTGPADRAVVLLANHHEVATIASPNHGSTACPSGRWDAVLSAMEGNTVPPSNALTADALNDAIIVRLQIQAAAAVLLMGAADPDITRVRALYARLRDDNYLVDW